MEYGQGGHLLKRMLGSDTFYVASFQVFVLLRYSCFFFIYICSNTSSFYLFSSGPLFEKGDMSTLGHRK